MDIWFSIRPLGVPHTFQLENVSLDPAVGEFID